MKSFPVLFANSLLFPVLLLAQVEPKEEPPALQLQRANEQYDYLVDPAQNPYEAGFADALKFIPLSGDKSVYLSLGGQYRARVESFTNRDWTSEDETFYSQRVAFHADFHFGKNFRLFGELYHGAVSNGEQFLESDDLDLHQAYAEITIPTTAESKLLLHLGRQELSIGAGRLVGLREGPNMRRSFDLAKVTYRGQKLRLQALYGKEVNPQFGIFDNEFNLFNEGANNPVVWSVGAQIPEYHQQAYLEIYYTGFESKLSALSDVAGEEVRHSIGLRSYGNLGKNWSFNTELIYQFGDLAGSTISAFNFEGDWKYTFINAKWKPAIGLKFDWSSGDRESGDGKLNTFNPLFVNPAIYSLAGINTPANLTSLHPSITVVPATDLVIFMDYAFFFRTSKADGLYSPPWFLTRAAGDIAETHIGDALGIQVNYEFNRNISADVRCTYYLPGKFLELSGESESTFYLAPTLSFKF